MSDITKRPTGDMREITIELDNGGQVICYLWRVAAEIGGTDIGGKITTFDASTKWNSYHNCLTQHINSPLDLLVSSHLALLSYGKM